MCDLMSFQFLDKFTQVPAESDTLAGAQLKLPVSKPIGHGGPVCACQLRHENGPIAPGSEFWRVVKAGSVLK
jgi:hypothetical protein